MDDPTAHTEPNAKQLASWTVQRNDQANRERARKQNEPKRGIFDVPEAGKQQKYGLSAPESEKRAQRQAQRIAAVEQRKLDSSPAAYYSDTSQPAPVPPSEAYPVIVPASSLDLPAYSPATRVHSTIRAACEAGIWSFPGSKAERAVCAVFRALWDEGYYMGPGIKFGGQWLVYPGDPLRYHSHFVATVHLGDISPMEVVAHGRLGTSTRKSHLACGWTEETNTTSVYTIEWAGFG